MAELRENAERVAIWVCTSGVALIVAWAFGIGAEIRLLSGVPDRVTALEARLNELERQVTRNEADISNLRREMDKGR